MRLPLGIDINFSGAGAISGLTQLAQRLESIGGAPSRLAAAGLRSVGMVGQNVTAQLTRGFDQARSAWYTLGGALGVPVSIAGVLGAVSGVRTLKEVLIGTNSQLETSRVRMSSMLRDFNDSKGTAALKGTTLVAELRKFGRDTAFDTPALIEAATTMTSLTKSPQAALEMTKLAAKLAALKGTNDIGWSAQSLTSAMQGNTASLRESFGINVSEDMLQNMSAMMGYGPNSPQGRYEAIKKLIEQKTGGKDSDIVGELGRTGFGALAKAREALTMPFTDAAEPMYNRMVKGLVSFNDQFDRFADSPGFEKLKGMLSDKFLLMGNLVGGTLERIGGGMGKLPELMEQYGPVITTWGRLLGVVVGVNVGLLVLKGTLGSAAMAFSAAGRFLAPIASIVANPLLVAGLLALSAAMWPAAKSLEVGGKSLDTWLTGVEKWSKEKDWSGLFQRPLDAVRKLLTGEYFKGMGMDWGAFLGDAFGADTLMGRIVQNVLGPMLAGLKSAVLQTFPELVPILDRFGAVWERLGQTLQPYLPILHRVALALTALGLAGRVLGTGGALATGGKLLAGGARLGAGAVALGSAAVANPLITAAVAGTALVAGALAYPFIKDREIAGKSIEAWVELAREKVTTGLAGLWTATKTAAGRLRDQAVGGLTFLKTWVETTDWDALGVQVGTGLRGLLAKAGPAALHAGLQAWDLTKSLLLKFKGIDWRGILDSAMNLGGSLLGWLVTQGERIVHGLMRGLDTLMPGVGGMFTQAWESIVGLLRRLGGLISTLVKPIFDGLTGGSGKGGERAVGFLTGLGQAAKWAASVIGPVLGFALRVLLTGVTVVANGLSGLIGWLTKVGQSRGMQNTLTAIGRVLAWLLSPIKNLGDAWETVQGRVSKVLHNIRTLWDGLFFRFKQLAGLFGVIFQPVLNIFSSLWEKIDHVSSKALEMGKNVLGFFKDLPANIGAFFQSIPDRFQGMLDAAPAPIKAILTWLGERTGGQEATPQGQPDGGGSDVGGGGGAEVYVPRVRDDGYVPMGSNSGTNINMAGLQMPVTVYAQNGAALDSRALVDLMASHLQPVVRQILEDAMNGKRTG